jgi:hypothetical protein
MEHESWNMNHICDPCSMIYDKCFLLLIIITDYDKLPKLPKAVISD